MSLAGNEETSRAAPELADALMRCTACLVHLDLSSVRMKKQKLHAVLRSLQCCRALERLVLDRVFRGSESEAEPASLLLEELLARSTSLTSLSLAGGWTRVVRLLARRSLPMNTTLRELCLADNELRDSGASLMAETLRANAALLELDLSANQVGLAGLLSLRNALLSRNRTLARLRLWTDRELQSLRSDLDESRRQQLNSLLFEPPLRFVLLPPAPSSSSSSARFRASLMPFPDLELPPCPPPLAEVPPHLKLVSQALRTPSESQPNSPADSSASSSYSTTTTPGYSPSPPAPSYSPSPPAPGYSSPSPVLGYSTSSPSLSRSYAGSPPTPGYDYYGAPSPSLGSSYGAAVSSTPAPGYSASAPQLNHSTDSLANSRW